MSNHTSKQESTDPSCTHLAGPMSLASRHSSLMSLMQPRNRLPEQKLRAQKSWRGHIGRPIIIHVVDVDADDDNKEDLA